MAESFTRSGDAWRDPVYSLAPLTSVWLAPSPVVAAAAVELMGPGAFAPVMLVAFVASKLTGSHTISVSQTSASTAV